MLQGIEQAILHEQDGFHKTKLKSEIFFTSNRIGYIFNQEFCGNVEMLHRGLLGEYTKSQHYTKKKIISLLISIPSDTRNLIT